MANQRQYEAATIFNVRCVDMRHLWEPSREFKGQPTQKPNYFSLFIVPKTQAHWSQEPVFGGVMQAFGKLLQGQLQSFAQQPQMVEWPIGDGDMPNAEGKTSEFAKGHWIFSASTGNAPNVELVQAGGTIVKLQNKVGVKPGDFAMVGVTAAVKQNNPRGVKFYLNALVFTSPGEEVVFQNSVSGAELMRQAQAQGLSVAGFSGSPGFGGGAPQGSFAPPSGVPGFSPGGASGFVPTPGGNASPQFANPPNGGAGPGSAFPSNPGAPGFVTAPQQANAAPAAPGAPGFATPNFAPPQQGGWPGR